jgi:hypothetical protein
MLNLHLIRLEGVVLLPRRKNYPQDYTLTLPTVREANEVARAWIEPRPSTVWERRIINHFISLNKPDEDSFKEHTIPVTEVERYLGYSLGAKEYAEIRQSVNKLIHFALKAPSGKRGIKGGALFAAMEFDDDGNIRARMNIELKKLFLELPSGFTIFELMEFNSLSSLYSQTLFPYLNSYKNLDCGYIDLDLNNLHELLGTPESVRKDFKAMRLRILDPVKQEINEKTKICFTWEGLKKIGGGKKIRTIRFRFLKPEPAPKALLSPEVNGALYLDPEKTFHDRKTIRKLGGVYDGKRWYVPEGINLRPFVGWMYEEDATNFLLSHASKG